MNSRELSEKLIGIGYPITNRRIIEEQVEEFSPLRHSNSFLKLKEFIDSEFKRKYKVGEDFKNIFK